ncbi:MAG: hypothetical protein ACLGH0_11760, partial [Thermoanaerobaculia bacterium]
MLTTFHAVRDLPVALLGITRRIAPANSLTLCWEGEAGELVERRMLMTCDETESFIQLAIIIISTFQKIGSLIDIVKRFVYQNRNSHPMFHDVPRFSA